MNSTYIPKYNINSKRKQQYKNKDILVLFIYNITLNNKY